MNDTLELILLHPTWLGPRGTVKEKIVVHSLCHLGGWSNVSIVPHRSTVCGRRYRELPTVKATLPTRSLNKGNLLSWTCVEMTLTGYHENSI